MRAAPYNVIKLLSFYRVLFSSSSSFFLQFLRVQCIWCRSAACRNNLFLFFLFATLLTRHREWDIDGKYWISQLTALAGWGLRVFCRCGFLLRSHERLGSNDTILTSILDVRAPVVQRHIAESKPEWNSKKNVYFIHDFLIHFPIHDFLSALAESKTQNRNNNSSNMWTPQPVHIDVIIIVVFFFSPLASVCLCEELFYIMDDTVDDPRR